VAAASGSAKDALLGQRLFIETADVSGRYKVAPHRKPYPLDVRKLSVGSSAQSSSQESARDAAEVPAARRSGNRTDP
jgi:hypothetical protein